MDTAVVKKGEPEVVEVTPKKLRRGSRFLTKYEIAVIVGERAKQIASGIITTLDPNLLSQRAKSQSSIGSSPALMPQHPPRKSDRAWALYDTQSNVHEVAEKATNPLSMAVDPVMMAKHELVQKRITMLVRRQWPDGHVEYTPVNELEVDETWLDLAY